MSATLHSYNTGHYFNSTARVYGWVVTVFSVFALVNGAEVALIVLPVGFLMQFMYSRVEIDLSNRTYKVGVQIFGLTFGKLLPLPGVDFLYLNKNNRTRLLESRASSMHIRSVKYDGYLKLANATKLHLVQEYTKERALLRLVQISDDLGIELRDQTGIKF